MNTPWPFLLRGLALSLAGGLSCLTANADITLRRQPAQISEPWLPKFAAGTLAAAVKVAPAEETVPLEFGSDNYIAQSFLGNDQYLRGIAIYGGGLNATPLEYTITLLDYGARGPVMTVADFNPRESATIWTSGSFKLGSESAAQLYLAFDGADSIHLRKDHAYVFMIASTRDSAARFYRTITDEPYPGGTGAMGPEQLSPDRFSAKGSRDILFAIYTATVGSN